MRQVFKELPVFVIPNFYKKETNKCHKEVYDEIIRQYEEYKNSEDFKGFEEHLGHDGAPEKEESEVGCFVLKDSEYAKKLYRKAFRTLSRRMGFRAGPNNKDEVRAYVSNKDENKNPLHHHPGSISMIYYFNRPGKDIGGCLQFATYGERRQLIYTPKQYDLVFFPSSCRHRALAVHHSCDETRVSLNMEFTTLELPINIFAKIDKNIQITTPKKWWQFWKK